MPLPQEVVPPLPLPGERQCVEPAASLPWLGPMVPRCLLLRGSDCPAGLSPEEPHMAFEEGDVRREERTHCVSNLEFQKTTAPGGRWSCLGPAVCSLLLSFPAFSCTGLDAPKPLTFCLFFAAQSHFYTHRAIILSASLDSVWDYKVC